MNKVIKEEKFEVTIANPQLYTRLEFEDGATYWTNRFGVRMDKDWEGVGIHLEELYQNRTK